MDPITLGVAAAAIFAAKIIERLGERTGDAVADSLEPLQKQLAGMFDHDSDGLESLQRVEMAPDSQMATDRLAAKIAEVAERDPEQAAQLEQLVAQLQAEGDHSSKATFQVNLKDRARVERIYQANRDIVIKGE